MNWIGWKMPKIAPVPKLLVKLRRFKDGLVYVYSGDVKMVWFSHSGDAIQFTSWQKVKSESWFHRTCHTKYKMHNAKCKMKNVKSKQWKLISQELSYKMNNAKCKIQKVKADHTGLVMLLPSSLPRLTSSLIRPPSSLITMTTILMTINWWFWWR